jgi:chorismate-pyruvate lyase
MARDRESGAIQATDVVWNAASLSTIVGLSRMPDPASRPIQWATPDLQVLVDLFYPHPDELGRFEEIDRSEVPEPYRSLLAHHAHMTVTVEKFHGCLVDVEVLRTLTNSTHYSRVIRLRRQSDRTVVMFGLVRLNRQFLGETVFGEIESQQEPLGRILIRHNVLRNVKLLSLWKITPGPELLAGVEMPELDLCYGRTALIYCNGVPAVELLEITVGSEISESESL